MAAVFRQRGSLSRRHPVNLPRALHVIAGQAAEKAETGKFCDHLGSASQVLGAPADSLGSRQPLQLGSQSQTAVLRKGNPHPGENKARSIL